MSVSGLVVSPEAAESGIMDGQFARCPELNGRQTPSTSTPAPSKMNSTYLEADIRVQRAISSHIGPRLAHLQSPQVLQACCCLPTGGKNKVLLKCVIQSRETEDPQQGVHGPSAPSQATQDPPLMDGCPSSTRAA